MRTHPLALVAVLACGCGPDPVTVPPSTATTPSASSEGSEPTRPDPAPVPADGLQQLEASLMRGDHRLRFVIVADGAVTSKLMGTLIMVGQLIELEAVGTFGDATPLKLTLKADGTTLRGAGKGNAFEVPRPAHLREALVLGLVRMGLLHNLALLVGGRPPDHAEEGVGDWLRTVPLESGSADQPQSDTLGLDAAYGFELFVGGAAAARASVWLQDGFLVERRQVVDLGEAKMHVTETFSPL